MNEIELRKEQIAVMREALEFYADHTNWEAQTDAYGHRARPAMIRKWRIAESALRPGVAECRLRLKEAQASS